MAKNEFSHKPILFFDNLHVIVRLKPLKPKYITVKVVRQTHTLDMAINLLQVRDWGPLCDHRICRQNKFEEGTDPLINAVFITPKVI